jgi:hypothetical protein
MSHRDPHLNHNCPASLLQLKVRLPSASTNIGRVLIKPSCPCFKDYVCQGEPKRSTLLSRCSRHKPLEYSQEGTLMGTRWARSQIGVEFTNCNAQVGFHVFERPQRCPHTISRWAGTKPNLTQRPRETPEDHIPKCPGTEETHIGANDNSIATRCVDGNLSR